MTSQKPLIGLELIDCAKANSDLGIEVAASSCGYGEELADFERELQKAGEYIGVKIHSFQDIQNISNNLQKPETIIAPDSPTEL